MTIFMFFAVYEMKAFEHGILLLTGFTIGIVPSDDFESGRIRKINFFHLDVVLNFFDGGFNQV